MLEMKGKYNFANIMIDSIDETTKEQIQSFLNHPAFADTYIAIMPDCHAGAGAVIGLTMKMNDYIIPNIVGVDIGCGMLSAKFKIDNIEADKLDDFIKNHIPSGFNINPTYSVNTDLAIDVRDVCKTIKIDSEKALRAIGSLGGGNHFIEAGYDSKGYLYITIHSGSRNFGLRVANYYQKKAKEGLEKYFIKGEYKDLEFLPINTDEAENYMYSLRIAQRFATANRYNMINRIIEYFGVDPENVIESIHNFIDDDNIIRKGATPAKLGQDVIIPFNMKDGLAICKGKGNPKYNYSAPHGAGRIMSRSQAKRELKTDVFIKEMKDANIYTTTANSGTLDEAPEAYKDKDIIIENIKETVDTIEFVKPIYNFKASDN